MIARILTYVSVSFVLGVVLLGGCSSVEPVVGNNETAQPTIAAASTCNTIAEFSEHMLGNGATRVVRLTEAEKRNFVAANNALESVTDHNPDEVWQAPHASLPITYVVYVEKGCITLGGAMRQDEFAKMAKGRPV